MCGIVGYIGHRKASEIILDGLWRLEYRGYDSAGLAVLTGAGLDVRRCARKIHDLEALVARQPPGGAVGLGHTRWATHGRPSEANAHPHADCTGAVVVVHNGILENYLTLRERLAAEGHRFRSETDTEVLAHLVEAHLRGGADLTEAVRAALGEVRRAYAVAVLAAAAPDRLVAAKHGAGGVVVGLGEGETFLASDIPALLPHTREVVVLEDGDVGVLMRTGVRLTSVDGQAVERAAMRITWDAATAQRGGYPHFMLKEIHEQPRAVSDTLRGRVDLDEGDVPLGELDLDPAAVGRLRRIVLIACGTSYHAALVARHLIERLSGLAAEGDLSSEFRYRDPVLDPETLVVAISQSGETADTLGAARAARERGAMLLAITNVVGSALAREAGAVLYTHAGPEIGVASTKTFTATLTAGYLLAVALGRQRGSLTAVDGRKRLEELLEMPRLMEGALRLDPRVKAVARSLRRFQNALYLGRGVHYPIALEGALKLKELSYSHAEGYAAGEMKHGPIALIDERFPVVALVPRDATYDRMRANVEEVRARDGRIVAVGHEGDTELARRADQVISIPAVAELLTPLVSVIPLQLLAYHVAALRDLDVDQPRNLAKSVTVE